MYKLVAAILLGNGVGGRMATAPHYSIKNINICSGKIEGRDQFEDLRADTKRILRKLWI